MILCMLFFLAFSSPLKQADCEELQRQALVEVAKRDDNEAVSYLLQLNRPVDILDASGSTALLEAARLNHYKGIH